MAINIKQLLAGARGENYDLHEKHVNPRFVKTLNTIGFDKCYTRAEGQYLWDINGQRYLDMLAGYGVFNVGRNNPEIRQTLIDFMEADYPSLVQLDAPLLSGLLAKELKQRMPNDLDYVYFTNSGTEGVETAIKFARCATKRSGIIHAKKSFHGLSNGSLSINGDETFREGFGPLLPDCVQVPFGDIEALEKALSRNDIAAFIVEPIQGKGVNIPPAGYLKQAQELCHLHKTLFIVDEIQSGMGRTGKFLAIEHENDIDPDMVILSKSLSGGFIPVGAVLTRKWIYNKVFSSMDRSVVHSSTFGQGNLAMAAGLASLDYIDEHKLMENATAMGNLLGNQLSELKDSYEFIKDIRWRGLMLAIEFGSPKSLKLKAAWALAHKLNKSLFPQAVTIPLLQDHNVLTQVAGHNVDIIKLIPPLMIDKTDVDYFVSSFKAVMESLHKFPGPCWEVISRIGKSSFPNSPDINHTFPTESNV
ncbi:MAG: aspartate aminotransferase family protein [Proteobacteria bacterium]|nr:aspartate aminotransferase family protein [Pseudomonadota bacterium]NOG59489.1 aspartate aminotransferase family protein [Pseudomonadota bacterium]